MALPTLSTLKTGSSADLSRITVFAPSVGALLISVAVVIFIVWPKFSEVLRLKTANQELATRAELISKKAQQLEELSVKKDELQTQLAAANQLLPSDKSVFTLIAQIEGAGKASGVLLSRIDVAPGSINDTKSGSGKPGSQSSAENVQAPAPVAGQSAVPAAGSSGAENSSAKIQVKLTLSGDYKSFLLFFRNALSMARVITIHDLSVSAGDSAGQVQSSFVIDAFWQPLPRELAAVETAIDELSSEELARLDQVTSTGSITTPTVPSVPLGRSDLFAPF